MPENRIKITAEDIDEAIERERTRADFRELLMVWDAAQKGYLDDVPTVS